MAILAALATGNLTAAGTWGLNDATGTLVSTSTASTALTTGNLDSAVFTPGAITVIGVLIRLDARAAGSPSNKITIILRNATDAVDVKTVVANVADLPPATTGSDSAGGWHFFKFDAAVLLLAAKNYLIRATLDSTSTAVRLSTNGTANNWQHVLITDTTQAPAAGDDMKLAQLLDGAANPATPTAITVTQDSTAATDYGSAQNNGFLSALDISKGCTLASGVAAATAYLLRLSGFLNQYSGSILTLGTSGTPIPIGSSSIIEFDALADGQYGYAQRGGATISAYGSPATAGKLIYRTKLSADVAAAATFLPVTDDTGWKSGDIVEIAGTTRSASQAEQRTLTADANAADFSVAALTNAHGGVDPIQAEIILLNRNVKMRVTGAFMCQFYTSLVSPTAMAFEWVEFSGMSVSSTTPFQIAAAGATFRYCSFRDMKGPVIFQSTSSGWLFRDCVVHNLGTTTNQSVFTIESSSGATFTAVVLMGGGNANGNGLGIYDFTGTFSDITIASVGAGSGLYLAGYQYAWSIDTLCIHGCSNAGLVMNTAFQGRYGTVSNFKIWRNSISGGSQACGILFGTADMYGYRFVDGRIFGNTTNNVLARPGSMWLHDMYWRNVDISGDTGAATTTGINLDPNGGAIASTGWRFENCTFGVATGIYTAHTQDFSFSFNLGHLVQWIMVNCKLASATEFANYSTRALIGSYIRILQHDQTLVHKVLLEHGTLAYETTTVDVSPSMKMTPLSATRKIESNAGIRGGGFLVAVANGETPTISMKVQKDGSYNGNAPRLIQKSNPAIGVLADVVLDTLSVGSGTWETISAALAAATADGVQEIVVDCDGTAGNIFIDTGSDGAAASIDFSRWFDGLPISVPGAGGGSAAAEVSHVFGG